MTSRSCLLVSVVLASAVVPVLLSGRQAQSTAAPATEARVRLSRSEAASLAREARETVKVELPAGIELTLWAPEELVDDPVAIDIDPTGTAYVTSTSRNNMPLDIRGHEDWMATVHTLRTVDALEAFYRREMAPERSEENGWIQDLNADGSRDIRDLAALKERVIRLRDTDNDGLADAADTVAEGFNETPVWDVLGGVLHHEGDLIVGVPPGVYRLRDTDKDGLADQRTTISEGYNTHPAFGGHGISGVMVGPDGRLYWEVGDMGLHVVDKAGRTWAYPNQGAVLRSELDGSNFEVFATGIRNLQEFAFDEHGNLISVDNDGDHQGETERLVYLPYGSDSGWRSNWQYGKYTDSRNNRYNVWMDEQMFKPRHAGQSSHIIPPVAPWHAGPSGMVYNPGTALSDEWQRHFFVSSFPGSADNARVYGFTLKEQGAGFVMDTESVLLRGILVVGMRIGPDGALYVTDWITGWDSKNNGRVWKLDAPAAAAEPIRKEVRGLLLEDLSRRTVASVGSLLRHADMRVRQKAQFELVRRSEVAPLVDAARDPAHQLTRLHGLWGVAQLARREPRHASHIVPFLKDNDSEIRAQAAKMLGDVRYTPAADPLMPLLNDPAPRVRFFAAEALGRIGHRPAMDALVEMLADNASSDVYLQHAGSLALASIGETDALGSLSTHVSPAVRTAAVIALRRLRHRAVARFLTDQSEAIVTDAARAINDDGSIPAAVPELAALLGKTTFGNEPLLRRIINANLRVGTAEAAERLAAFASDHARPEALRAEAIAALGVWPSPSPMDRVDGFYLDAVDVSSDTAPAVSSDGGATRAPGLGATPTSAESGAGPTLPSPDVGPTLPSPDVGPTFRSGANPRKTTGLAAARLAVQQLLDTASNGNATRESDTMRVALTEAAGRLEIEATSPALLAQLERDPSAAVRLASLQALRALKVENMDELMKTALADEDPDVRRAALGILPELPIPAAAKVEHLAAIVRGGSLEEQQGALELLGSLKTPESRRLLGSYVDDLSAGTIAPALQIDLLEAVQKDESAALVGRIDAYVKARKADTLVAGFRDGLLVGGDSRRGRRLFLANPAAECTRCHAIRGRGTDVGPELTDIGAVLSPEQLLDALIAPNSRIAPGFGLVGLTLENGERVGGILHEETDAEVTILVGDPPTERRISKADIAQRTDPVSAMAPLGLTLAPRDVRDLVAFLATLTGSDP
ncbi:MAG: HEAT repeat domain-containing protein [Vicinamibacteraceae bacterium]